MRRDPFPPSVPYRRRFTYRPALPIKVRKVASGERGEPAYFFGVDAKGRAVVAFRDSRADVQRFIDLLTLPDHPDSLARLIVGLFDRQYLSDDGNLEHHLIQGKCRRIARASKATVTLSAREVVNVIEAVEMARLGEKSLAEGCHIAVLDTYSREGARAKKNWERLADLGRELSRRLGDKCK